MTPLEDREDLVQLLGEVPAFAGISVDCLRWFLSQCREMHLTAGEVQFVQGAVAEYLVVVLQGAIEARSGVGADQVVFRFEKGRVTGVLPFSRMDKYPLSSIAALPSHVLQFPKAKFPELYQKIPDLIPRLVSILTDRVREATTLYTQQDKMAALGKMSAGLAHELNNPAAAARRASQTARELFGCFRELMNDFTTLAVPLEILAVVKQLEQQAGTTIANPPALDSLARSDREQELGDWLDELSVENAWDMAGPLVEGGFTRKELEHVTQGWPVPIVEAVLGRLSATIQLEQVLAQMYDATTRMSDLVKAMKEYTFLDRAALTEFDLNQNIETTLKIFAFRFKKGVELRTDYDTSLPLICANGGQLSQVWTNLVDNALDAIESHTERTEPGRMTIRTRRMAECVRVEVEDNGGGIPEDVARKIFDPFFTTKGQGKGTGLGLDVVFRVIRQHQGSIHVEPRTGGSIFVVDLPLQPPRTSA